MDQIGVLVIAGLSRAEPSVRGLSRRTERLANVSPGETVAVTGVADFLACEDLECLGKADCEHGIGETRISPGSTSAGVRRREATRCRREGSLCSVHHR